MNNLTVSDMYLAATLISYGGRIIRIDDTDLKRQKFVFDLSEIDSVWVYGENDEVIKKSNPNPDDIKLWFNSKILLFPPTYPDSVRRLKSMIHGN